MTYLLKQVSAVSSEQEKNQSNWIGTWGLLYADLISLLLMMTILFLSAADFDSKRVRRMIASVRDSMGVSYEEESSPSSSPTTTKKRNADSPIVPLDFQNQVMLARIAEKLRGEIDELATQGQAEVVDENTGFVIRIQTDPLFYPNSTRLRTERQILVDHIADLLISLPNRIEVTGFYDDQQPAISGNYPSPWAIAAAYASTMVEALSQHEGMDPRRLTVRSRGQYDELASNSTPEGQNKNRRIEILITREAYVPPVKELPPAPDAEKAPKKGKPTKEDPKGEHKEDQKKDEKKKEEKKDEKKDEKKKDEKKGGH